MLATDPLVIHLLPTLGITLGDEMGDRISVRKHIIDSLRRDLIGPSWKDGTVEPDYQETLHLQDSNPTRRYLGGYLEPSRNREATSIESLPEAISTVQGQAEDSEESSRIREDDDDRDDSTEPDLMLSTSSMGLTFATEAPSVHVEIEWGEYVPGDEDTWIRSHHTWSGDIQTSSG